MSLTDSVFRDYTGFCLTISLLLWISCKRTLFLDLTVNSSIIWEISQPVILKSLLDISHSIYTRVPRLLITLSWHYAGETMREIKRERNYSIKHFHRKRNVVEEREGNTRIRLGMNKTCGMWCNLINLNPPCNSAANILNSI